MFVPPWKKPAGLFHGETKLKSALRLRVVKIGLRYVPLPLGKWACLAKLPISFLPQLFGQDNLECGLFLAGGLLCRIVHCEFDAAL